MTLGLHELRVLGALIEKEITTPDLYPLSLNALQAACNQRSSRDPILELTEEEIRGALHRLGDLGLAGPARPSLHSNASRVPRFEHHARTRLQLKRDETALLCLLLLRGPQTPGELRSRADRLFAFDDLSAVVSALDRLAQPDRQPGPDAGPLVLLLARQPGARESRYTHLLGDPAARPAPAPVAAASPDLATLEARIAALEERLAVLESRSAESPR